jgi:hypothetical protein
MVLDDEGRGTQWDPCGYRCIVAVYTISESFRLSPPVPTENGQLEGENAANERSRRDLTSAQYSVGTDGDSLVLWG